MSLVAPSRVEKARISSPVLLCAFLNSLIIHISSTHDAPLILAGRNIHSAHSQNCEGHVSDEHKEIMRCETLGRSGENLPLDLGDSK